MEDEPQPRIDARPRQKEDSEIERIGGAFQEILADIMRKYDKQFDEEFAGKHFALKEGGLLLTRLDTSKDLSIHFGSWNAHSQDRAAILYENYQRLLGEFRQLADELTRNRAYRNVNSIHAFSWLVTKHSNAFKHLGFRVEEPGKHPLEGELLAEYNETLSEEDMRPYKDIPPSLAVMSKEDFVATYGSRASDEGKRNL